jgi:AraC-like DNA-binding protein
MMGLGGAIDLLLRGAGIAASAALALLLLRQVRASPAARFGLAFSISVAAFHLCPLVAEIWRWGYWGLPVFIACFAGAGLFWLFARSWFDDDFRARPIHWAAIALGIAAHAWFHLRPHLEHGRHREPDLGALVPFAFDLAFAIAAIVEVRRGKAADLVERRRNLRDYFTLLVGALIVAITALHAIHIGGPSPAFAFLPSLGALLLTLAFIAAAARLDDRYFPPRPSPLLRPAVGEANAPDPQQAALLAALLAFMAEGKGYRVPGLTIAGLAERLGTQEHRLRRLINGRLGHRNFNEFVNGYRLTEAKARLADPKEARLPVLTIALEAGFQSIGPFNRAFKEDTGVTPVEFRRIRIGKSG